jgi:hypothetical protein
MLEFKPDYERSQKRIDAFWKRELLDRPAVQLSLPKPPEEQVPLPVSHHATPAERWLDTEYQTDLALAQISNSEWLADSIPVAYPNLGPEQFAAFYGCPLIFGDVGTSWTKPVLNDWRQADTIQIDWENIYLKKLLEMSDALLDAGRDRFITGMPDWHETGDCLAALRDPHNLALDLLENAAEVRKILSRLEQDYFSVYDLFYGRLRTADQPIATWLPLPCRDKFYVVSCDFSILISNRMYIDFFLPAIRRECQFLDHSIYHLDGPGALRHLDTVLSIPELDALQFVPGAGNEGFPRWIPVYQKAQAAGKAILVYCELEHLERLMETLDPHGLLIQLEHVPSREAVEPILKRLEKWCTGKG